MTGPQPMRRKRGWMNLKVTEVIHETPDTDTFILVNEEENERAFDYIAGQYLTFRFDDLTEKPIVRSYTMSSSPCQDGFAAFTVKRVEKGLVSNWLCDNVKVGSILRARGPIGKFCYDPAQDNSHLIMTAGGSGVTPFVSIMREHAPHLGKEGHPKRMTLLVSYRTQKDLICWKELQEIDSHPNSQVITTLTREDATNNGFWKGRIDEEMLKKAIDGAYGDSTFMTCGPQAMMDLTENHCKASSVAPEHIKTESFES